MSTQDQPNITPSREDRQAAHAIILRVMDAKTPGEIDAIGDGIAILVHSARVLPGLLEFLEERVLDEFRRQRDEIIESCQRDAERRAIDRIKRMPLLSRLRFVFSPHPGDNDHD